jgi:hypothetical protein
MCDINELLKFAIKAEESARKAEESARKAREVAKYLRDAYDEAKMKLESPDEKRENLANHILTYIAVRASGGDATNIEAGIRARALQLDFPLPPLGNSTVGEVKEYLAHTKGMTQYSFVLNHGNKEDIESTRAIKNSHVHPGPQPEPEPEPEPVRRQLSRT